MIRQALIAQAQAQADWGPATTNDPDGNLEGLANVVSESPNDAPSVTIKSPPSGSRFASGEMISFQATAIDNEDGELTVDLVWRSNIDGEIGRGGAFSRSLSDGHHQITATVTDSGGKSASASGDITVGSLLTVSVTTDKPSYETFQTARITVTVTDGAAPVEGARAEIQLTTAGGIRFRNAKLTDSQGVVKFTMFVFAPLFGRGTYVAEVTATKEGFVGGKGTATFIVEK